MFIFQPMACKCVTMIHLTSLCVLIIKALLVFYSFSSCCTVAWYPKVGCSKTIIHQTSIRMTCKNDKKRHFCAHVFFCTTYWRHRLLNHI
ncbi:hypothetical protein F4703DRAFT_1821274 [Phycomyces blakesleeanus]